MIKRVIDFIVQLQFLSGSARAFIFGTGTRFWEAVSTFLSLSIGALLLIDGGRMFSRFDVYRGFLYYGRGYADEVLGVLLLLFGACITAGLALPTSYRAICLGRWGMSGLGLVWAVMAVGMAQAGSPTIGVVLLSVLSIGCWFVGEHLGDVAEAIEQREAACCKSKRA